MFIRLVLAVVLVTGLLCATGCGPGKLNVSKTMSLGVVPARSIDLDAQPKPQKLTIEFSSSAVDVSVYVFKFEDAKDEDALVLADPKKALGEKKGKAETFTVDVPENTPVRIVVRSGQKTDVQVKVTN